MNGQDAFREAAAGLMDLADALEGDDELAEYTACSLPIEIWLRANDKRKLQGLVRRFAPVKKHDTSYDYQLVRNFGGQVLLHLYTDHANICVREVVGKKIVKVKREVVPAQYVDAEEEVDDVRWICPDSILDDEVHTSSSSTEEIQTTQGETT